MASFVIDTSATLAWYSEDEATPYTDSGYPPATLDKELITAAKATGMSLVE